MAFLLQVDFFQWNVYIVQVLSLFSQATCNLAADHQGSLMEMLWKKSFELFCSSDQLHSTLKTLVSAGSHICIFCPFPLPETLSDFGFIKSDHHTAIIDYVIGFIPHWEHPLLLICQLFSNNKSWNWNRFQSFVWFTCIIYM